MQVFEVSWCVFAVVWVVLIDFCVALLLWGCCGMNYYIRRYTFAVCIRVLLYFERLLGC